MNDKLYRDIGKRIKLARRACSITQERLAEMVGVTNQHISNIEVGNKAPSYELFYAIAEKLNCSAYSLLPAESSNSGKYFSEEIMHLLQSANSYQQNMIISYIEWYLTQPLPSAVKEHE